jgi:hypothetical protein
MQVVELVGRYDISCAPMDDKIAFIQNSDIDKTCIIILRVSSQWKCFLSYYIFAQLHTILIIIVCILGN